jgi:hypothetical protein
MVYQGSVNVAIIHPGEMFREPLRLNSERKVAIASTVGLGFDK